MKPNEISKLIEITNWIKIRAILILGLMILILEIVPTLTVVFLKNKYINGYILDNIPIIIVIINRYITTMELSNDSIITNFLSIILLKDDNKT
jgi:hypothetical protein